MSYAGLRDSRTTRGGSEWGHVLDPLGDEPQAVCSAARIRSRPHLIREFPHRRPSIEGADRSDAPCLRPWYGPWAGVGFHKPRTAPSRSLLAINPSREGYATDEGLGRPVLSRVALVAASARLLSSAPHRSHGTPCQSPQDVRLEPLGVAVRGNCHDPQAKIVRQLSCHP